MKLLITIEGEPKEVAQFLKELNKEDLKRITINPCHTDSITTAGQHPGATTYYTGRIEP